MGILLAQREAEIAFLKDTIRIECEERMGLVAKVAQLQKQSEHIRVPSPSPKAKTPVPKEESLLNTKEKALYNLFQQAQLKKEKKLAKQKK